MRKKLWRQEQRYPRGYINNLRTNLRKNDLLNILNILQPLGITSIGQIAKLVEQRTENPNHPSNISDLTPKSVWTSVDISSKCGQYVDKIIL